MLAKLDFQIGVKLSGDELNKFLRDGIAMYEKRLIDLLSGFNASQFLDYWRPFIREVDEVINYHYGLSQADKDFIFQLKIGLPFFKSGDQKGNQNT
jgi:hypothetical protein